MKCKPSPVNRGFLSIELLIVLVVIMLATIYGYPRYARYMEELEWGVEARNMTTFSNAAKSYIRDNRDQLISQVSGGTPVTLSGAALQTAGYLPAGFGLRNNAAQNYQVSVARDPKFNQKLVAFVLTAGGAEISFKGLRYISQKVEGAGGYVWPSNVAVGAFAGWELNLASYGLSAAQGRLVTWLSSDVLGTDLQESDRLYRYQVGGRPDLNRMHTAIDMNGNSLNKAKDVNAETGHYSGQLTAGSGAFIDDVTAGTDIKTTDGWFITKGNKGWMNETHGGGIYMDDNNWIKTVNGKGISTTGQLKGGTVHAESRLSTGDVLGLGKISVKGSDCTTIGDISRDAKGAILSCQDKKWKSAGTADAWFSKRILRGNTLDLGSHSYCALALASFDYNNWRACEITRKPNGNWQLRAQFIGNGQSECQAVCF